MQEKILRSILKLLSYWIQKQADTHNLTFGRQQIDKILEINYQTWNNQLG